jgi:hypothetical protein
MSSLSKRFFKKSANRAMLKASVMSSWWKVTSENPRRLSSSTADVPLAWSLAVKTTVMPLLASCLHTSSPIPLFPPVTRAILAAEGYHGSGIQNLKTIWKKKITEIR